MHHQAVHAHRKHNIHGPMRHDIAMHDTLNSIEGQQCNALIYYLFILSSLVSFWHILFE